MSVPTVA
jgi:hypothetical protein